MALLHTVTLALLLGFSLTLTAQPSTFQIYNTADGFSGNVVHDVLQDNRGFLWVLNDYQVYRFDGEEFDRIPTPPNLGPMAIFFPYQDSLIAGYNVSNRVNVLHPETGLWQSYTIPKRAGHYYYLWGANRWGDLQFLVLDAARDSFAVGIFSDGTYRERRSLRIPFRDDFILWQLDADNQVYGVDRYQLVKWSSSGEVCFTTDLRPLGTDIQVRSLQYDPTGTLLLLISSPALGLQIYTVDESTGNLRPHACNRLLPAADASLIESVLIVQDTNLLLSGIDRRLLYYDAGRDILHDYRPELLRIMPNFNSLVIAETDATGTIWLNSQLGLVRFNLNSANFTHYLIDAPELCEGFCSCRGISENARGDLFVNAYQEVVRVDQRTGEIKRFKNVVDSLPVPSGLVAEGNQIWLGNGRLWDPATDEVKVVMGDRPYWLSQGVYSEDPAGNLWAMFNNELFRRRGQPNEERRWLKVLELEPLRSYHAAALHAGASNQWLWLSVNGRLWQYYPATGRRIEHELPGLTAKNYEILSIREDRNQVLWLGTNIGLLRYSPAERKLRHYTTADGLPNNTVCGLLAEGDSALWLSTYHGLARLHLPTDHFTNFFTEDGLSHNEFNRMSYYQAADGRMYFGGLNGVNAFHPAELMRHVRQRTARARVSLAALEYSDERRDTVIRRSFLVAGEAIHFHHRQRAITFEYLFTDYRNPDQISYSFLLEGLDNAWSTPSKHRSARYSSLPAGEYVLRVRARDNTGGWHPNELAVPIVVHPPWWRTSWAYALYLLLTLAGLYLAYSLLQRRLRLRAKLAEEQRVASQLKEINAFKSRFYTNLTHEFRTPLTVILGMAEQIRTQPREYLASGTRLIERNGAKLLRLVNQMLDLSKLEDHTLQLKPQQADIVPYLRYLTESFQTYANHHNLALQFFSHQEQLVMDFDAEQLQQVMTNLIVNAVKFTPSGGRIRVSLQRQGEQLLISVADTGVGIASEALPYIFDRFYQAEEAAVRRQEGTGIGLAHSQELARLMGGQISAQSIPKQGTTFIVQLPILNTAPIQALTSPLPAQVESPATLPLETVSPTVGEPNELPQLLIIEDNADVVTYLRICLQSDYSIDMAYNGRVGTEKALANIPDLIICDVMLPYKDGFEVCAELKEDERTSHIPIVMLTARVDTPSKMAGLRRGADVYLSKPFAQKELRLRLEQLLKRQQRLAAYFTHRSLSAEADLAELGATIEVENVFVEKVKTIIAQNYQDEDFALPQLCRKIGLSRSQLFRKMKALMGTTPSTYLRDFRLHSAKSLLENSSLSVSEVAWKTGFRSVAHFSKAFREKYDFPPSETNK